MIPFAAKVIQVIFSRTGFIGILISAVLVVNFGLPFGIFNGRVGWKRIAGERETVIDTQKAALYEAGVELNTASMHLSNAASTIKDVVDRANAGVARMRAEADRRVKAAETARVAADSARTRWDAIADRERRLIDSVPINMTADQRIAAVEAANREFLKEAGL
jgi:hypothetical protein